MIQLYLGFGGVLLSAAYFVYTSMSTSGVRISNENWEILGASALPLVTLLGLTSVCLFTWALWPIWSFLTLPLVAIALSLKDDVETSDINHAGLPQSPSKQTANANEKSYDHSREDNLRRSTGIPNSHICCMTH